MNNPNPFVPKGSILELQSKRRSRLKLAVFCVLAVGVAGLSAMLIQGCKREQADTTDLSAPTIDTNDVAVADTNMPAIDTNLVVTPPATPVVIPPTVPPVTPPVVETATTKYIVVAGDTLDKIAKKNGVTVKALEAANPGVIPTKLKVKQELTIPAATSSAVAPAANVTGTSTVGEVYSVKSGDTLTKIAKHFGISIKAIQAANGLTTTRIKVGEKLKIPGKGEAAAPVNPVPEPAMVPPPVPEPVAPPATLPAQ